MAANNLGWQLGLLLVAAQCAWALDMAHQQGPKQTQASPQSELDTLTQRNAQMIREIEAKLGKFRGGAAGAVGAGVGGAPAAGQDCIGQQLSSTEARLLLDYNKGVSQRMSLHAAAIMCTFLDSMWAAKPPVYLKLQSALRGGHSVQFSPYQHASSKAIRGASRCLRRVVATMPQRIRAFIGVERNRIIVKDGFGERTIRTTATAEVLSDSEKMGIRYENQKVISRVSKGFGVQLTDLVKGLQEAPFNAYVKLHDPIPKGHSVRYELAQGSKTDVKLLAGTLGLHVSDQRISRPSEDAVVATAEETKRFIAQTPKLKPTPL